MCQCGICDVDAKKYSDGCLHCYIHKGDLKRNIDTNKIVKKSFNKTS